MHLPGSYPGLVPLRLPLSLAFLVLVVPIDEVGSDSSASPLQLEDRARVLILRLELSRL